MTSVAGSDAIAAGSRTRHIPMLIGGEPALGRGTLEVRDSGRARDVVAAVKDGGPEHVDVAVAAAGRAAARWRGRSGRRSTWKITRSGWSSDRD